MSITARPLTYNAYHNPVSYEEPGRPRPLTLPDNQLGIRTSASSSDSNTTQQQPLFPALHLFSLNNTFAPKHILLGPPTVTPTSRLKIGRQTTQKTAPHPSNTFFDSKVLSRTHAELWAEHGKIYIRDLRSSNGTFINGNRLSPEGCESEPAEIKNEDLIEFGIDILAEDGQQVLHHKVAARAFTILDAHAADRAQHDWTNLYRLATLGTTMPDTQGGAGGAGGTGAAGQGGAGAGGAGIGPGGSIMGPGAEGGLRRGKGGKSFDHVIALLQAEMTRFAAEGGGSPEAIAARAAAAAAKHRERMQRKRSAGAHDGEQGPDGAPLSPLDETAQRLTLLLSSLSSTRSQLDALRAAANQVDPETAAAAATTPASEVVEDENNLLTVTPSTPAVEQPEEAIGRSAPGGSSDASQQQDKKPTSPTAASNAAAEEDPILSHAAPVPKAAIQAAAQLPALRTSLTSLRSSVRDVRASLLKTLRERELRESDEQLAGTSVRPPPGRGPARGASGSGPGGSGNSSGGTGGWGREFGRRLGLGQGLSMGILGGGGGGSSSNNNNGKTNSDFIGIDTGQESGLVGLPSSLGGGSGPTGLAFSSSSTTTGGGLAGTLGSPPKEPLPSLPPEAHSLASDLEIRPGGHPLSRSRSSSRGSTSSIGSAVPAGREHMAGQLRMSSVRSSSSSASSSILECGGGRGGGLPLLEHDRKMQALPPTFPSNSSFPPAPISTSIPLPLEPAPADALASPIMRRRQPLELPPLPSVSAAAVGVAGAGRKRSADEHFEVEDAEAADEAEALHRGGGGRGADADGDRDAEQQQHQQQLPEGLTISTQGSGTAPTPSSPEQEQHSDQPQERRGPVSVSSTTITAARLDRAENALRELRTILANVQRAQEAAAAAAASNGKSVGGGGGGSKTKAELVWDGLQTKFAGPATTAASVTVEGAK
ncbi:hypothetical protein V8E36_001413 [Tilletia maclaganii]